MKLIDADEKIFFETWDEQTGEYHDEEITIGDMIRMFLDDDYSPEDLTAKYIEKEAVINALMENEPEVWNDTDEELSQHQQWEFDLNAVEAIQRKENE